MKPVRIYNDRIFPGAKFYRSRGVYSIRVKSNTPPRIRLLQEIVYLPVLFIILISGGVIVLNAILAWGGIFNLFQSKIFPLRDALFLLTIILYFWIEEVFFTEYDYARMVFGRALCIRIEEHRVCIGRGPFRKTFGRDHSLRFVATALDGQSAVYQNSARLALCVADSRLVPICEVFPASRAADIAASSNSAMDIATRLPGQDEDPFSIHPDEFAPSISARAVAFTYSFFSALKARLTRRASTQAD